MSISALKPRLLAALVFCLLFLLNSESLASDQRLIGTWSRTVTGAQGVRWNFATNGTGTHEQDGDAQHPGALITKYFTWSTNSANTTFTYSATRETGTGLGESNYDEAINEVALDTAYTLSGALSDVWSIGFFSYTKQANYPSPYTVSTFVDLGGTTPLTGVNGITYASSGTFYITLASGTIHTITNGGTLSSLSPVDAEGAPTRFTTPAGITVDPLGNLYVADTANAIISKITPLGVTSTLAGVSGQKGLSNGTLGTALFTAPTQITLDKDGALYVIDDYRIRKISPATQNGDPASVSTLLAGVQIPGLNSLVADSTGNLFFSTTGFRGAVKKLSTTGDATVFAGSLSASTTETTADGTGQAASFVGPLFLTIDKDDNLYVSDRGDLTLRKITPAGVVTTLAGYTKATSGTGSVTNGSGRTARFKLPELLTTNTDSDLFVLDSGYIRKAAHPRTSQTLTFGTLINRLTNEDPFTLAVTASSGLPVTLSVTGPASLIGYTLVLSGSAGTVKVTASQEGDATYDAAAPVSRSFTATYPPRVAQNISFPQPLPRTYGVAPITLLATSNAGLPVSFKVVSGPGTIDSSTLTLTGAGSVVLLASNPGDSAYLPASTQRTLVVSKKALSVSISNTSRAIGQVNPAFPLNYSGFVGTDTIAGLDKVPLGSVKATTASIAGQYPLTLTGGLDNNYTFTPAVSGGSLTVVGYGGSYEALLADANNTAVGKVELTVSGYSLAYSARLFLANELRPISFVGKLTPSADLQSASGVFGRSTARLPFLDLVFDISSTGVLSGSTLEDRPSHVLRDGELFANILPGHRIYTPSKTASPWAGSYSVAFAPPSRILSSDTRSLPEGTGYASVTISPATGIWTLAGKLADGTPLAAVLNTSDAGKTLLWNTPYLNRLNSSVSGSLSLTPHPSGKGYYVPDTNPPLVWSKISPSIRTMDAGYRDGLNLTLPVAMDPWLAPSPATRTTPLVTLAQRLKLASSNLSAGSFALSYGPNTISFGSLQASLPSAANLSNTGVLTVTAPITTPLNATKWTIAITPATGAFSGSFSLSDIVPPAKLPTVRSVKFFGTLRQPTSAESTTDFGTGFFLLPGLSTTEQVSGAIHLSYK